MRMTFSEIRKLKDRMPNGTMHVLAQELGVTVETVRNYFGGENFQLGQPVGIHRELGSQQVILEVDEHIIQRAQQLAARSTI